MSIEMDDILEENERNEIRGTLIGVSRMNTLRVAQRSVDIVDPYTREIRLWVNEKMQLSEIESIVTKRLGMLPIKKHEKKLCYEIKYGSKYNSLEIHVDPFFINFA